MANYKGWQPCVKPIIGDPSVVSFLVAVADDAILATEHEETLGVVVSAFAEMCGWKEKGRWVRCSVRINRGTL